MTAVTGNVFSAAQFNQHVRDNLNTTAPAVATTAGRLIVTTAANVVTERNPSVTFTDPGDESTASTTYGNLTTFGPQVGEITGTRALIMIGCNASNNTGGLASRMVVEVTGATTIAADDANGMLIESGNANDAFQWTWTLILTGLNSGFNTFVAKYRTSAGGGVSTFNARLLCVVPF
jgi:hypothetical protein